MMVYGGATNRRTPLWLHSSWLAALLLFLITVLPPALLALSRDFTGLYGQDAYAYYDYAVGPLRAALLAMEAPPSFHWPPGYPLLVVASTFLFGLAPRAGQVMSLLGAGLVSVLTFALAREVLGMREHAPSPQRHRALALSFLAGLLVALNGQLWQSGVVVMADTTALAAATLGVLALVRHGRQPRRCWLLLASGALAWAFLTRLAYLLVALPSALYALRLLARLPRARALRDAALALLIALLILSPVFLRTLGGLLSGEGGYLPFAAAGEIYRWNPLNALRRVHITADGVLSYPLPNGLYYALAPFRTFYLTPLLAPLSLVGLLRPARGSQAELRLLVAWGACVYLFHAGTAWQNIRFTLAYLPPLAILAASGFGTLWENAARPGRRRVPTARHLLAGLLVVGLAWMGWGGARLTVQFIARMQDNVETVRWVQSHLPEGSRLLAFELVLTLEHESDLEVHQIFFLSPDDLRALTGDNTPTFLLLDVAGVEQQWRGRAPEQNYRWLRDGPGLQVVGRRGLYTLFEVQ